MQCGKSPWYLIRKLNINTNTKQQSELAMKRSRVALTLTQETITHKIPKEHGCLNMVPNQRQR